MVTAGMVIPTTRMDTSIRVAVSLYSHVVHEGMSNTAECSYTPRGWYILRGVAALVLLVHSTVVLWWM